MFDNYDITSFPHDQPEFFDTSNTGKTRRAHSIIEHVKVNLKNGPSVHLDSAGF